MNAMKFGLIKIINLLKRCHPELVEGRPKSIKPWISFGKLRTSLAHHDKLIPKIKAYLDSTPHVLTILSCGILLFSSLLCLEFRNAFRSSGNEIIGYVTYKNKAIKVKADSTVVWQEVEQKQPVARRDTIQSLELSDAVITLNDGTELKIEENSMVLLDFTENKINLDFKYGSIQTKRTGADNNSLVIHAEGVNVNLADGDLNLKKKEKEDLSITSTRGQASIQKDNKTFEIKENSVALVKETEAPVVKEMEIQLLNPAPSQVFYTKEKTLEINFNWNTKWQESKIQISRDANFSKIHIEQNTEKAVYKNTFPIGSYFWRVSPSKNKVDLEIRKFTVAEEIPFRFKYPLLGSEFYLKDTKPTIVSFSWDKDENTQSYTLEISKQANFSSIDQTFDVIGNSFGVEFTSEGKYFFRVKTKVNRVNTSEKITDTGYFALRKQEAFLPPTLVNPKNGIALEESPQILLGWKSDPSYKEYNLILSENPEFTLNTKTIKTKENYALVANLLPTKTYFWKVEGLRADNKAFTSLVFNFKIQEKIPVKTASLNSTDYRSLNGKEEIIEEKTEEEKIEPPYIAPILQDPEDNLIREVSDSTQIKFHWKKQPRDLGYKFYLYKQKDLAETLIFKKELTQNSLEVDNPHFAEAGKFFWLVEGKYKKGDKFFYEKSKKREFKLLPKLTAPKIKKSEDVYYIHEK